MPDPEKSPANSTPANADPAAAQAVEAESARELDVLEVKEPRGTALELRLKNLRETPSPESTNAPPDPPPSAVQSFFTGAPTGNGNNPASDLLNAISLNLSAAQQAAAILLDYEQLQPQLAEANPPAVPPSLPNLPIQSPNYRDQALNQQPVPDEPRTPEDFDRIIAAQTQTLQNSGDLLSAALEKNTFMANSIFTQLLHLLDRQNQSLADLNRKISDLNGQIKSLKNP